MPLVRGSTIRTNLAFHCSGSVFAGHLDWCLETGKRFQFASSANLADVVSFKREENRHFLRFNIHL